MFDESQIDAALRIVSVLVWVMMGVLAAQAGWHTISLLILAIGFGLYVISYIVWLRRGKTVAPWPLPLKLLQLFLLTSVIAMFVGKTAAEYLN